MENQVRVGLSAMIVRDNKVLLGKRKGSHGAGEWAFPGGHMEYGEEFESSLGREIEEETGMILKSATLLRVINLLEYMPKHYVDLCFVVEAEGEPVLMEPNKCEGWEWFSLEEIPKNLFSSTPSAIEEGRKKGIL
jgi:8-oxo-dGTP diphosphatase